MHSLFRVILRAWDEHTYPTANKVPDQRRSPRAEGREYDNVLPIQGNLRSQEAVIDEYGPMMGS
jgi:hypothetical protein